MAKTSALATITAPTSAPRRLSRPPTSAGDKLDRWIGELERLQRVLLRRRPDQYDDTPQQDADRDRGEDGGEHHLSGHLAHQRDVDEDADGEAEHQRRGDRADGMIGEQ